MFFVPHSSRSISLASIMPRRTSFCMWSATPVLAKRSRTRASVFPGPGPAARVSGILSGGYIVMGYEKIPDLTILAPQPLAEVILAFLAFTVMHLRQTRRAVEFVVERDNWLPQHHAIAERHDTRPAIEARIDHEPRHQSSV